MAVPCRVVNADNLLPPGTGRWAALLCGLFFGLSGIGGNKTARWPDVRHLTPKTKPVWRQHFRAVSVASQFSGLRTDTLYCTSLTGTSGIFTREDISGVL